MVLDAALRQSRQGARAPGARQGLTVASAEVADPHPPRAVANRSATRQPTTPVVE